MNRSKKNRYLVFLLCFMAYSFGVLAQERISFTWIVDTDMEGKYKWFFIATATDGEQFTVDWGDNSAIGTYTGKTYNGFTYDMGIEHAYDTNGTYTVSIVASNKDAHFTHFDCIYKLLINLDASGCTALTDLYCYSNQISSLNVSGCTALTNLSCNNNQLSSVDVNECTALTHLYCYSNPLNSLDVSENKALMELSCFHSDLSDLNVRGCMELTKIWCYGNLLNNLDLSTNTALAHLECYGNQLTDLNLIANIELQFLDCKLNQLSSLDLSECKMLNRLICNDNQLEILNVNGCVSLMLLDCYNNQLESLDLSGCIALEWAICNDNLLKTINLNNCISLIRLISCNNQLSVLDIRECITLKELDCSNNQFRSLVLNDSTTLRDLNCSNNQLNNLDISGCIELNNLDCSSNQLNSLDMSKNLILWHLKCYNNQLPLSELYTASKKISFAGDKSLGTQILPVQTVNDVGYEVDFSTQTVFDSIATVFDVKKGGVSAAINADYAISNGIITFRNVGNYKITMTNAAIVSYPWYPAEVIAEFNIGDVGIIDVTQAPTFKIYPNQTNGMVYLQMESNIKVYNMQGQLLQESFGETVDLSAYSQGMYLLQVGEKRVKVIKN